jgi:hypothetical protein
MNKSLAIRIAAVTEDAWPSQSEVSGSGANNAEKGPEVESLHTRFNPSRVGFGILGVTKEIRHPGPGTDEDDTAEIRIGGEQ